MPSKLGKWVYHKFLYLEPWVLETKLTLFRCQFCCLDTVQLAWVDKDKPFIDDIRAGAISIICAIDEVKVIKRLPLHKIEHHTRITHFKEAEEEVTNTKADDCLRRKLQCAHTNPMSMYNQVPVGPRKYRVFTIPLVNKRFMRTSDPTM